MLLLLHLLLSLVLYQPVHVTASSSLVPPVDISSNSATPSTWSLILTVESHRHHNEQVTFSTRSYCWNEICSYPGPTIHIKAGDNFTLHIVNKLGAYPDGDEGNTNTHVMNTMNSPNTTNFHTHGLHIDPYVDNVFLRADPGDTLVYDFQIPSNHGSGMMWYHDHVHGSSTLKVMGGLVGGLVVDPSDWENIPDSILSMSSYVLVLTRLKFDQQLSSNTQTLSQGCGQNWTCDAYVQAPECNASSPAVSPYDSFRIYSYYELARETGSTLDINAVFEDPTILDMMLVNGQYQPVLQDLRVSDPVMLRIVAALGGGIVTLRFTSSSSSSSPCSMTVIAYDGVYLYAGESRDNVDYFRLVEGGRGDVQVVCDAPGLYDLVNSGGVVMLQLNVTASDSDSDSGSGTSGGDRGSSGGTATDTVTDIDTQTKERDARTDTNTRVGVLDSELASIVRPSYLGDLTSSDTEVQSQYSVAFWQDGFNQSNCGFWMGVGTDCSAQGAEAPEAPDECRYSQFSGSLGLDPAAYKTRGKLVMSVGGVAEWVVYGENSDATHPFHIHVNHFQVVSYTPDSDSDSAGNPDAYKNYFTVGQFRDTLPLFYGKLVVRFLAADFAGEIVTHCHFLRHEDLGMMDTFLVTPAADDDDSSGEGGDGGVFLGMNLVTTVVLPCIVVLVLLAAGAVYRTKGPSQHSSAPAPATSHNNNNNENEQDTISPLAVS